MRRLLVPFSALMLAAGCGNTEEPVVKRDCELEVIDLSACDRSTLAALQAEGIWNTNLVFSDGDMSPTAFRFGAEPKLAGLPMTDKRVSGDSFFLVSDVENAAKQPVRFVFAGCTATSPTQVKGEFRRCTNGVKDLEGTFEASRVTRRAGEAEADRVQLVAERALSSGSAVDVFVADGHAYVTALTGGLFIYDVSDPANPVQRAQVTPSDDSWNQVWVQGKTAYIASSNRGILIYDLTNVAVPRYVSALPASKVDVRSIFVNGTKLYAASPSPNAEVIAYDITNPTAPVLDTRYYVDDSNPSAGQIPMEVFVSGNTLYVSHWTYGLAVVDVTNPKAFKRVGKFAYPGATSRAVVVGTVGSRTLAFEAGENWDAHLRILDVSAPENVYQAGAYRMRPEVSIRGLALSGTKLYVAHYQDGLRILDVTNPSEPRPLGFYNTWRETDPKPGVSFYEGLSGVKAPGDGYVYGADTLRGLLIFREAN